VSTSASGTEWINSYGFDAYWTYRVDLVGAPAEYVTPAINGYETHEVCRGGDNHIGFDVYNTSSPPPAGYDPAQGAPPAPTSSPQLTYTHNVPYLFDQTFEVIGNYTVDASTDLGKPFVDLLNGLCARRGQHHMLVHADDADHLRPGQARETVQGPELQRGRGLAAETGRGPTQG
jgi:hypothetical protein